MRASKTDAERLAVRDRSLALSVNFKFHSFSANPEEVPEHTTVPVILHGRNDQRQLLAAQIKRQFQPEDLAAREEIGPESKPRLPNGAIWLP